MNESTFTVALPVVFPSQAHEGCQRNFPYAKHEDAINPILCTMKKGEKIHLSSKAKSWLNS